MKLKSKDIRVNTKGFNPKCFVALDVEATGVDVWGDDMPFAVSMCDERGNGWYCDWPVDPYSRRVKPHEKDIQEIISILSIRGISAVFHNSPYDVRMLRKIGVDVLRLVSNRIHDTLFSARVCFTLEDSYGLKHLCKKYLELSDNDEKEFQQAVNSARRKVDAYNRKAVELGKPLILKGEDAKQDYWLPKYFDPENDLCEKYCRLDTFRTMMLFLFHQEIFQEDKTLKTTYDKEMNEIWPVAREMEAIGMAVDPITNREESKLCRKAMFFYKKNMLSIVQEFSLQPFPIEKITPPEKRKSKTPWQPPEFNPGSSQQLMRVLYLPKGKGGLGIETKKRNRKTGKLCTDKDTLQELMYEPFVRELVAWRAAKQALTLFFTKFNELMKPDPKVKGGFVLHPNLNQCGTKTGRFSCTNPNLQQISAGGKKSLSGTNYSGTKVFKPRPGYLWLVFDYSQQEARIFGDIANVPSILEAAQTDSDVYAAMAQTAWGGKGNPNAPGACIQALDLFKAPANESVAAIWKKYKWHPSQGIKRATEIALDWLTGFEYDIVKAEASLVGKDFKDGKGLSRQRCKSVFLARLYGGGPGSFAHLLYCSIEEARAFDLQYQQSIPEIKPCINRIQSEVRENGYVITLYGRKLRVPASHAYKGINYKVQGTAADMMKDSIVRVNRFLKSTYLDAYLINTIHDSLFIECAEKDYSLALVRAIKNRMEDTSQYLTVVPMSVEVEMTRIAWGVDAEKIKV